MSTDNPTPDVEALTALEKLLPPAPWHVSDSQPAPGVRTEGGWEVAFTSYRDSGPAVATFIAAMRNQLPALLAELARVTGERNDARRKLDEHHCVPTQDAYDRACAALWKHRGRADALAAAATEVAGFAEQVGYSVPESSPVKTALLGLATRLRDALRVDQAALHGLPHPAAATSGCVDGGSKTTPEATPATAPKADEPEPTTAGENLPAWVKATRAGIDEWKRQTGQITAAAAPDPAAITSDCAQGYHSACAVHGCGCDCHTPAVAVPDAGSGETTDGEVACTCPEVDVTMPDGWRCPVHGAADGEVATC